MKYRNKNDHEEVIEAWENKEGSDIPDWIQGRGIGVAGGILTLMCNDKSVISVDPDEWVSKDGDDIGTIFIPAFFLRNYEELPFADKLLDDIMP